MMHEHRLHYLPITNDKANTTIRLRHLKYVKSINKSASDLKFRRTAGHNNVGCKKVFFSLKATNKLEISQPQLSNTIEFSHLYRLAKNLKKVSFLQTYDPLRLDAEGNKQQSLLLTRARNLKSLGFSYEIQDPNFSGYERIYETILALNGNTVSKQKPEVMSGSISSTLQNLNVVLPRDIVFVVDFRVSNEILDYPPVNRRTHDNANYIWNFAASYFTLSNVENSYAYKFESLLNIRKVFLSCEASNNSFNSFNKFLSELAHIDTIHVQLKKPIKEQLIYFKDLAAAFKPDMKWMRNLKNLIIDCENIDFDPIELEDVEFPRDLTSLHLNFKHAQINSSENFHAIEKFPAKLEPLRNLKMLKIEFPTTFLMNQMFHNLPDTLNNLEVLHFVFGENTKVVGDEDIYLNSLLECLSTMPKLKEFYVKTSKLNYTYCAYLSNENMPSGLKRLEWIDDTLQHDRRSGTELNTKQWIECKKFEDLNIVLSLLTEEMEHLEIPFVFDGLESEFVALRFLEVLSSLKNLKNLKLALGFKTLDESNIESITNFISKARETSASNFHMDLNIYYRKIKGEFIVDEIARQNNTNDGRKECCLQFIRDINC
jgi:hypothetical protein